MIYLKIKLGMESCVRKYTASVKDLTEEQINAKVRNSYTSIIRMGGSVEVIK